MSFGSRNLLEDTLALGLRHFRDLSKLLDLRLAQRTELELQRAQPAELVVLAGQQADGCRLIVAQDARVLFGVEFDQVVPLKFRVDPPLLVVQLTVVVERPELYAGRRVLVRRCAEVESALLETHEARCRVEAGPRVLEHLNLRRQRVAVQVEHHLVVD